MDKITRATTAAFLFAAFLVAHTASVEAALEAGQEEFGLSKRQLVQNIERVEQMIAKCMADEGFTYIAVDSSTILRGMDADKVLPGLEEEQFIERYGFGISTMYTGKAPQEATGYSPAKIGLGRRNVEIYNGLTEADKAAYTRTLFGKHTDATFVVGLESENFARCGGCTLKAIAQVFEPHQLEASYYNPIDAQINADARMQKALRDYAAKMRADGFDIDNPDTLEIEVRNRLDAITGGRSVPFEQLSAEQRKALEELQDYERRLAVTSLKHEEDILEPVEERVEAEFFARRLK